MRTVLQLIRFYLSAAGLRHILLAVFLIVAAVGGVVAAIVIGAGGIPPRSLPFMLVSLPVMALLGISFGATHLFRALSAPRPLWLASYARLKMLMAILIYVGAVSVLIALAVQLLAPVPARATVTAVAFVLSFVFLSGAAWIAFLPPAFLLLVPIVLLPGLFGLLRVQEQLGWSGAALLIAAVVVTALAWVAFASWYLRLRGMTSFTRQFASLGLTMFTTRAARGDRGATLPDASRRVFWHARPGVRGYRPWLLGTLLGLAFVGVPMVTFMLQGSPSATVPLRSMYLAVPLALTLLLGVASNQLARRARLLWLRTAQSRAQLFADAEKELWHSDGLVMVAGMLLGVVFLLRVVMNVDLAVLALLVLAAAAAAVFSHYLGLMWVRGIRAGESFAAALLLATFGVATWALLAREDATGWILAVAVAQIGAGLVCRAVAQRRWADVDWASFRPMRLPGQGLRP